MLNISRLFTKVRRKFYYYGAFVFSKIVLVISCKFSVKILSSFFGKGAYYIARGGVNIAKRNLKKCFPDKSEKEIVKIMKKLFRNETKNFFELANFPRMDSDFLKNISSIENVS